VLVCVPVASDGSVDPRWGRADRVALAEVTAAGVESWQEHDVGWGALHDSGPEGTHHARIARFLLDHRVEAVVANHMGAGMEHMLGKMEIAVHLGAAGPARDAALSARG